METEPTHMCELLVGSPDVDVLAVTDDGEGTPLVIEIVSRADQGWCRECGVRARLKEVTPVTLIDMTCFGRDARLVEVIEERTAKAVSAWIDKQPQV